MKIFCLASLLIYFSLFSIPLSSQSDWIIQLKEDATIQDLNRGWGSQYLRTNSKPKVEYIAPHFKILKLSASTTIDKNTLLKNQAIQYAELNLPLETRATPNDPLINQQWHLDNISAPKAWDQTTGGLTFNKDTVVLGVIDLGFLTTHDDLKNRVWQNRAEIPSNGKDDDANGYIDDVYGLSLRYKNEKHTVDNSTDGLGNHGTSVAGLMCGESNNRTGIAGMMWNSKMMLGSFSANANIGDLIECFNYMLDQRIRYNTSNGKKGAFVVTINYSGGISFAKAIDYPIWCGMYDKMGFAGILNCGATTNKLVDVDDEGDMPSTCPSEFLIAVTNTGKDNRRITTAGYGLMHIDLGSPGEGISSTHSASTTSYQLFNGTSAATPVVAGAVGLLYSYPCKEWGDFVKSFPAESARLVKKSLLTSVDKNADLTGKTVSGGRLNIARAIDTLKKYACNRVITGTQDVINIKSVYPNPATTYLSIMLHKNQSELYNLSWTDVQGSVVFSTPTLINQNFTLTLPKLSNGVYFLSISNSNHQYFTKKILIHQ